MKEWHVVYVLKGIPDDHLVHADNFLFCRPGRIPFDCLKATAPKDLGLQRFLIGVTSENQLTFATFRVFGDTMMQAFTASRHLCEAAIDVLGFVREVEKIEAAPIALFRELPSTHLSVRGINDSGMAHLEQPNANQKAANKEYDNRLLLALMGVMDLLTTSDEIRAKTPMERQLAYSCSAFRRSITPDFAGLEYIGKFAALEALVCGSERQDKKRNLVARLSKLFRHDAKVPEMVEKLWEYRNEAVHEAQLAHSEILDDKLPLTMHVGQIYYLFVGAILFANDKRAEAQTIPQLWTLADTYVLPEWAQTPHPRHSFRYIVTGFLADNGVVWNQLGAITDQFFPRPSLELEAAAAEPDAAS